MNGIFEEGTSLFEIGAVTTVTGLVLVFAMLIFLVLILWLFGCVVSYATKSGERKSAKTKEELAKQFAEEKVEEFVQEVCEHTDDDSCVSAEIVAVIAAAVNELYTGTGKKPVIRAVKKSGSRRSAWASAGLADNTRSF